jgi:Replication-relaxation
MAERESIRSDRTGRPFMAGNSASSLVVQERDLRLFEALNLMRVIDREQAKIAGGFNSTTRANARLLALTRAGYLKRAFLGSRRAVYWLASNSRGRGTQKEFTPREPASLFLRHRLEINKVYLLLKHSAIPVPGWWLVRWQGFQKNLASSVPLIPDGYFELRSSAGARACFVEVDLGTEALPVIQRKVQLYLHLATSGEFPALFHQPQFRVLVIANSERRLQNLREAIAKLTDKIFWLTTLECVNRERFWSPVWLRPTGDQRHSLL